MSNGSYFGSALALNLAPERLTFFQRCLRRWQNIRKGYAELREAWPEIREHLRMGFEQAKKAIRDSRDAVRAARNLASAPDTLPKALERAGEDLCRHPWWLPSLRAQAFTGLAAHANTPPEILVELLDKAPRTTARGLTRNPVLPLLTLECPEFPSLMSLDVARSLLSSPELTPEIARLLMLHPDPMIVWEAENSVVLAGEVEPGSDWRSEVEAAAIRLVSVCRSYGGTAYQEIPAYRLLAELGYLRTDDFPIPNPGREHREQRHCKGRNAIQSRPQCWQEGWTTDELHWAKGNLGGRERYSTYSECIREVLALHPRTPTWLLASSVCTANFSWVAGHPNANNAVFAALRSYAAALCFSNVEGSSCAAYFAMTRIPTDFWPRYAKRIRYSSVPHPCEVCEGYQTDGQRMRFSALECCAAISLLPDFQDDQWGRLRVRDLLNDNNRYVRAAARERFLFRKGRVRKKVQAFWSWQSRT